ncbi:hypothetical protein [Kibdelosporangium aridum]|uniref:hypothetical protein n=1 Tax=Kibdelosporangium aridum TaxID=2030 RepID=UPI000525E27C
MNENDGLQLLAPLRELDPDARSSVDIEKAKRVGRRTSRRRAVVGAAAVVGVFALVGIGVPALSGAFSRGAVAPAVPPAEFNPLIEVVTVGTAGGFQPQSYETGRTQQVIRLKRADGGTGSGTIIVYPPGPKPDMPPGLSFEWTPGAWAWIRLDGPEPDMQARADRVRQSVNAVPNKFAKVPFTLDRSAEDWMKVSNIATFYDNRPGDPSRVTLNFSRDGLPGTPSMSIVASEDGYGPGVKENLGGHEATVTEAYVAVTDRASGLNAIAMTDPSSIPAAKQVIATLEFVPDATNPAKWVTNLFR